ALHADSVSTLFDAMDCFVDGPEEFRIGLFESKPDVNVVFLAGLVDPIAALRARFCRRGSSGRGSHQAFLFLFENIFVFLYIDRTHAFVPRTGSIRYVETYQFSTTTEAVQRQGPSRLRRHTAGVRYPRLQRAIPRSAFSVPLPALLHPECRNAVSAGRSLWEWPVRSKMC